MWRRRSILLSILFLALLAPAGCGRQGEAPAGPTPALPATTGAATPTVTSLPTPASPPATTATRPAEPAFAVNPRRALSDEPVAIRLGGLPPGQVVTVTATTRDDLRRDWEAWAAFTAGANGSVDLTVQAPVTGTYTTVAPLGLIWSMAPQLPAGASEGPVLFAGLDDHSIIITLRAEAAGAEIAVAYLERDRMGAGVTVAPVTGEGVVGYFYTPGEAESGPGPYPAIITLGGSGGNIDAHRAALLASRGYAALALDYFTGPGLPAALEEIPLEYFANAIHWLQAQPAVDGERIGVVGSSRGGELALLLGATYPQIKVVVSYAGSGVVMGETASAVVPEVDDAQRAAWTLGGEPVPFATSQADLADYVIPVERIEGPVLLISGEEDEVWPAALLSQIAFARLEAHNHPYPYAHLCYPDAGHFLGAPYWPLNLDPFTHPLLPVTVEPGGTRAGTAAAQADAWAQVLALLEETLKP